MSASKSKSKRVVSDSDSSSDESTVVSVVSAKVKPSKADHAVALMERIAKLKSDFTSEIAALEKEAKAALKGKLPKRASNKPKGETPDQVKHWNNFVKETHELMKTEGWPQFSTLSKGEDKPSVTFAASKKSDKGVFVFSSDGREPAHKDAMAYAGFRKRNGEYSNPEAEERARQKAEKKASKDSEKKTKTKKTKAKKAESESESESESEEEKPKAKKASKSSEKTKTKKTKAKKVESESESDSESEEEKPKAKPKPKKALSEDEKPKAAPAAPASSLVEAAAAAAAAVLKPAHGGAGKSDSDSESDSDEEEELVPWTLNGKSYLRSSKNECWFRNADGTQGKWAGKYDPSKNKIDASAKEPECE
jgi:hypothetical protein